jgi:thiol-disulfide isomerase/thioredoxin
MSFSLNFNNMNKKIFQQLWAVALVIAFAAMASSFILPSKTKGADIHFIEANKADGSEKSFQEVMDQFKGKVVFIDFWASWCGPCRGEFKYSPEIHEKFKDNKDIVFLYITFDRNEDAWKAAVEKFGLSGYHIYPGNDLKGEVYQKFEVTGIPRYMIMGKDGRVINDNAPRPSAKDELIQALSNALKN